MSKSPHSQCRELSLDGNWIPHATTQGLPGRTEVPHMAMNTPCAAMKISHSQIINIKKNKAGETFSHSPPPTPLSWQCHFAALIRERSLFLHLFVWLTWLLALAHRMQQNELSSLSLERLPVPSLLLQSREASKLRLAC